MLSREILQVIADNPSSTEVERAEALASIQRMDCCGTDPQNGQAHQDDELERWLLPKRKLSIREACEERESFQPDTNVLLDDINLPVLLGAPTPGGAVERLRALLARTNSDFVKEKATRALEVIALREAREQNAEATYAGA